MIISCYHDSMKKKNLIFDADGTIWDSAEAVAESWSCVIAGKYADLVPYRITKQMMYHVMGRTMKEIGDILLPDLSEKQKIMVLNECMAYENEYLTSHPGTFYPGLVETLKMLKEKGCHCFVVSNCQDGYLEAMLKGNRQLASCIEDTECYGRTGLPKSGSICVLMDRNHIAREESVYIGDTAMDETAAREAGISFIHAAYGFGKAVNPDGVIHKTEELSAILRSLEKTDE